MRAPTGGIILVESIHIRRSLVRFPGAKAMAQAEGMAITRAKKRGTQRQNDRVHGELNDSSSGFAQRNRPQLSSLSRKKLAMLMASPSVLKLVSTVQRMGKKMTRPTAQARTVTTSLRRMERCVPCHASRFLPIIRIRKKATMLARMTATMPPAEAPPMSLAIRPY